MVLRTDTCSYLKNLASERRVSFSAVAQELIEVGIATRASQAAARSGGD